MAILFLARLDTNSNDFINKKIKRFSKQITDVPSKAKYEVNKTLVARMAEVNLDEYEAKLNTHASNERVIILALVDAAFFDMTLNFYETSIEKYNITNYLFIASDYQTCEIFVTKDIHCYVYMIDNNANKATIYKSFAFNQKMNIRTYFILDALKLGFTVLHTDVDIVFFSNPLENLYSSVHSDVACLSDNGVCNAGFIYIKPSNFSIDIYRRMKNLALETKLDDQTALNRALASVRKQNGKVMKRHQLLDINKYQCGLKFFEQGHRYFADSATCPQCIVVHNNWIVSKEAKRYRFREVLLWSYDDNGYYSNDNAKYLIYSNAPSTKLYSSHTEIDALKTALYLGHVLSRVVILPRFHLYDTKSSTKQGAERPLNNWIKMSSFDDQFYKKYRENAFLDHIKVSLRKRRNITSPFWIKTHQSITMIGEHPPGVNVLAPTDENSVTTEEIVKWFGRERSVILKFHSLYGVFGNSSIPTSEVSFCEKLKLAFKHSDYRQLKL